MNSNRKLFLRVYLAFTLGIIALGLLFMLYDMIRAYTIVFQGSGISGLVTNGVFYHKIGELIIAIATLIALFSFTLKSKEALEKRVNYLKYIILAGGILNIISWFFYQGKIPNTDFMYLYTPFLFIISIVLFFVIKPVTLSFSEKYKKNLDKHNEQKY